MLANFHTHTTFCDGASTPEEIAQAALTAGFSTLGFSGHGTTPFDLRYCMTDMDGYMQSIRALQQQYRGQLDILLGVEEDAFAPVDRSRFDYIIGSCHYVCVEGVYFPVDSGLDYMERLLERFGRDPVRAAEAYYSAFCTYLLDRKPDIIGHFDLLTKFDEGETPFFLDSADYRRLAQTWITRAASAQCVFEVNSGAMARGLRTTPYPSEELLHTLHKLDARLILSSDSHHSDTLAFGFEDMKHLLRQAGFRQVYTLTRSGFVPRSL